MNNPGGPTGHCTQLCGGKKLEQKTGSSQSSYGWVGSDEKTMVTSVSTDRGRRQEDFRANHISRRLLPSLCTMPNTRAGNSAFSPSEQRRESVLSSVPADVEPAAPRKIDRFSKATFFCLRLCQIAGLRTRFNPIKDNNLNKLRELKIEFYKGITDGALCPCSTAEPPAKIFLFQSSSHLTTAWKYLTSPNTRTREEQMWLGPGHRGSYCIGLYAP